jgi:hypothetical protein
MLVCLALSAVHLLQEQRRILMVEDVLICRIWAIHRIIELTIVSAAGAGT